MTQKAKRQDLDGQHLLDLEHDAESFRCLQSLQDKLDRLKEELATLKRQVVQKARQVVEADLDVRSMLRRTRRKR